MQQQKSESSLESCLLLLQVPRTNDKKALAAEQMLASLHGLLTLPSISAFSEQVRERISFEIAVIDKRIGFYVWVPKYLKDYVAEQIYAQYPSVQISEVDDYSADTTKQYPVTLATDLMMETNEVLPIKMFQSFDVDPLAAITATLAKFDDNETAWIQLIMRPASSSWQRKNEAYLSKMKAGKTKTTGLLQALWAPPEASTTTKTLTEYEQIRAKGAEEKSQKLAYEAVLRVVYRSQHDETHARMRMQSIIASYKQFNTTYLNGFKQGRLLPYELIPESFQRREFARVKYTLNIEEVATLYHLPHTNVETPFIFWASSQTAEPPANLPIASEERNDISPIGMTHFRGHDTAFGLPRSDRGRHLYILGQTGVGKSGLLELLTISDVFSPYGFAIIDPHGDYAQNTLARIPKERANDVIYFNAADTAYPIAFNPMEVYDPKLKNHTCSELIGVLKRMFESWGPRLEYILRYTILALLDYPNATMLDITRMLTDKKFRNNVLEYVNDPVVRNFWLVEFASWNDKFAAEAIAPVLNKVGAFTANPLVRNIIGQPKSSFNIRQIMDERKILIINLSRGLVGEDNASLLGALIVTKIQMAAMSRADVDLDSRVPFYLYVDEFQNFATDSFATILSEARKYGLNLTVANQYIAQMLPQVKDAVFGNVGSIVAFRMSADDAGTMQRYFEPKFLEHDLVHMHNRHFVISMAIGGEKAGAFSAISLNLPPLQESYVDYIIDHSRRHYAKTLMEVQDEVNSQYLVETKNAEKKRADKEASNKAKDKTDKADKPEKPAREDAKKKAEPKKSKAQPVASTPEPAVEATPAVSKAVELETVDPELKHNILLRKLSQLVVPHVMRGDAPRPLTPADTALPVSSPARLPREQQPKAAAKPKSAREATPAAPQEHGVSASELADGEITLFSRSAELAQEPQPITLIGDDAKPASRTRSDPKSAGTSKTATKPSENEVKPVVQTESEGENAEKPKRRRRRRRKSKAEGSTGSSADTASS